MTRFAGRKTALMVGLAAVVPLAAVAQETESTLGEITVTAQKRETSLQDVPFSIAAQTEEQIRNSGATNIVEFARNVSGLTITDLGPGQSQIAIRGISAGQVIRDQPGVKEQVGIYLDESPISVALFTPDLELFDLSRVEVLRGPQGTLFGAGSTAGTLRYITAQPSLEGFEGAAEVGISEGTDSDFGGSIKGVVNVPMGETAALRLVGYYNELAGFIDAVQPDGSVNEDVDGGTKTGARVALLLQPSDSISITPRIVYQKLETDGYPRIDIWNILGNEFTTTQPAVNLGEREQFTQLEEGLDDEFKMADLKLEFGLGAATLTSITTYIDREVVVKRDASQLTGSVTFDIGGEVPEVRLDSTLFDTTDFKALSQELRLSGGSDILQWLVGAFYQDVDKRYGQFLPTPGYDDWQESVGLPRSPAFNGAPPDSPFFSDLEYDFQQFAVFGEATYSFTSQWSLTGGVRYYDFEEDRLLTFAGLFADPAPPPRTPGSTESDGFSPRAILTFSPNEDVTLNAQVARGFRLGGINDPINTGLCTPEDLEIFGGADTWEDEKLWNYELGAKTRLAGGKVIFNAAAFLSDIDNLQAVTVAGTCSSRIIFNVPKARSTGVELELFARPNEMWDFGISATWVEAELRSTVSSTLGDGSTAVVGGLEESNRLPTAPELQAAASVGLTLPFGSLEGFGNFTVQYVGDSYTQIADQLDGFGTFALRDYGNPTITEFSFDPKLPSYSIGNLRFGVRSGNWEAAAFVNNLWDERAFLSVDTERGRVARVGYLTNRPRTYGLTLRMSF